MGELEDLERILKQIDCERELIAGRIKLLRASEPIFVPLIPAHTAI